ncbi:MAG: hypothetical protein M1115_10440, partial [Actinobacteria bacterium]|nr:hypothetical protein [Actinomycetota bacterium]
MTTTAMSPDAAKAAASLFITDGPASCMRSTGSVVPRDGTADGVKLPTWTSLGAEPEAPAEDPLPLSASPGMAVVSP